MFSKRRVNCYHCLGNSADDKLMIFFLCNQENPKETICMKFQSFISGQILGKIKKKKKKKVSKYYLLKFFTRHAGINSLSLYFLFSKLPQWIRSMIPPIFYITEKAWNYYPYTVTGEGSYTGGYPDNYHIWHNVFDLITAHTPISAQSVNFVVFWLQSM